MTQTEMAVYVACWAAQNLRKLTNEIPQIEAHADAIISALAAEGLAPVAVADKLSQLPAEVDACLCFHRSNTTSTDNTAVSIVAAE